MSHSTPPRRLFDAVLFDLDGTLADTAPDLAGAANKMRRERGLPALPLSHLRQIASAGASGLISGALGIEGDHPSYVELRDEFLANYEANLCVETKLFPGIEELLSDLDGRGVPWGVVTNKVTRFTVPLVSLLGLSTRAACIVSGDTTPHSKPHPAPLLHAANIIAVAPERIVYVGDDLRDVQAGVAAGMATVAAAFGYCGTDTPPAQWGAHYVAGTTAALHRLLRYVTT